MISIVTDGFHNFGAHVPIILDPCATKIAHAKGVFFRFTHRLVK